LSYIIPGQDATVDLIYDDKFKLGENSSTLVFSDVGTDPLQTYTIEEFSQLDSIIIIPSVIE
jgi:hypothetical protein